jgi:hypothetical protein
MNEPPLQTAELRAANLLSALGTTVPKVFLHQLGAGLKRHIGRKEDDALLLDLIEHVVIDDFAFVLGRDARKILLFRFGDS